MIPPFARRTDWKTAPNELSARLKRLKSQGVPILDLTESNPTRCHFKYLNLELLSALNDPNNLNYEPSPKGRLKARQIIQNDYRHKQIEINPEQIFLTSSTSEAYSFIFRLLLNPGERILAPQPSYPLFQFLTDLNDVAIDFYPLVYDRGWNMDVDKLKEQLKKETKALILVHPNNPTGSFVKKSELKEIVQIAKDKSLALISDEVFSDYDLEKGTGNISRLSPFLSERASSLAEIKEVLTFTLGGISKTLGLPQMKLAWTVVNGPEKILNATLERLEIIHDTYLSVNIPAQNALASWFSKKAQIQEEIKKRIKDNQTFITSQLASSNISYLEPEGGWYGILHFRRRNAKFFPKSTGALAPVKLPKTQSEEEWVIQFLEEDRVLVHPGYFFDFAEEAFIVMSLITEPNSFREGISRILKRVNSRIPSPSLEGEG